MANNAKLFSAYMRPLSALSSISWTKLGNTHIVALSWMWFMSQAGLKNGRDLTVKIGSFGLKKCVFVCDLTFSTGIAM